MKRILASLSVILVALAIYAAGVGLYMYYKPVSRTVTAPPDYEMSATELFNDFKENSTEAGKKYLGKIVLVRGEVTSIDTDAGGNINIALMANPSDMFGVTGEFAPETAHKLKDIQKGDKVTLKGEVAGKLDVGDVVIKHSALIGQ